MSARKIEQILDECVQAIRSGQATVEECLDRHPEDRLELRPLLQAVGHFNAAAAVVPSASVTRRGRAQLYAFTQSHPRRAPRFAFPAWRLAGALATLVLAFATFASALAQSALPQDMLYPWKLVTERVWSAFSRDPIGVEMQIADRRVDEFLAVSPDVARQILALRGYEESLLRLKYESTPADQARIAQMLAEHHRLLQLVEPTEPLPLPNLDLDSSSIPVPTLIPDLNLDSSLLDPDLGLPDLLP